MIILKFINPTNRNTAYQIIDEIQKELPNDLPSLFISSVAQQGLTELKDKIWGQLN